MPTKFEKLDKNNNFQQLIKEYDNYDLEEDLNGAYGQRIMDRILKYFKEPQEFTLYHKIRKFREKHS